jgi:hypothetical protein
LSSRDPKPGGQRPDTLDGQGGSKARHPETARAASSVAAMPGLVSGGAISDATRSGWGRDNAFEQTDLLFDVAPQARLSGEQRW